MHGERVDVRVARIATDRFPDSLDRTRRTLHPLEEAPFIVQEHPGHVLRAVPDLGRALQRAQLLHGHLASRAALIRQ